MTTNGTRYDLVLFGSDLQGEERAQAVNRLAQWMKIDPEQGAQILEQRGLVIARGLDADTGAETQRKLLAIGIRCNLRPCNTSGLTLELAAVEKPATVITCPACGHVHQVKGDEPAPTTCEQCEIVFAKYENLAKEKKEREQIRQTLVYGQQRSLEREQKEQEERLAQQRRRQLEDEIRKQLGLPRLMASRTGLISSAAGIYLLGIVMGAGGLFAYNLLSGSGTIAPDPNRFGEGALAMGQAAAESGVFDPGMVAEMQVSALLDPAAGAAAAEPGAAATDPGVAATGPGVAADTGATPGAAGPLTELSFGQSGAAGPRQPGAAGAGMAAPNGLDALGFLDSRLADLKNDTEWDIYLLDRIRALHERGAAPQAMALVEHLQDPELRFDRGARLADDLGREGRSADAEDLYLRLGAAADQQPDHAGARGAAYATLARHRHRAGRPIEAAALLQQAMTMAATLTAPADQAAAESEIAALLTDLGRPAEARAHFQAALGALGRIPAPAARLAAIPPLAQGYAKAGYRASALNLLDEATRNIASAKDAHERERILGVIAQTNAQLGDRQGAMGAAARIADPAGKDRALYRLVATELAAGRLADAIDLATGLRTPAYQALAAGSVGLRQLALPAYRPLAAQSAERAAAAVALLTNPAEQAAVTAELARFAARGGDSAAADRGFAQALRLAASVPSLPQRDRALAILATNEALALRLADARSRLPQIADTQLRFALTNDLAGLGDAAKAVGQ